MPRAGAVWVDVLPNMSGFGRQLQREIGEPVAQASRAAGEAGGEEMVGGLREKVKAGGAAVGLALGAAVAASAVSQLEKEKTGDRLAAQLGLSGKQAERAGKAAGSLYSKAVVDTFEDGAAAVRAVMSSGLVDEKATTRAITSITTKVSDLAATFDQDLTMTANAAAQMIRTGLAKDGAQALDLLTRGLQGPADKAGDLLETVNEYSTQWRKMGLDGASAIGLLNQAVRAGARDSDVAADAIKEFSIRAVDGSDTTKAGFKALGLSATDMATKFGTGGKVATAALDLTLDRLRAIEDPIKREAAAVALFGTQAEDLGEALFAMDPSAAASGLGKVGGAARQVGDTIRDNTSTRIEVLKRQLTSVFGTVVSAVVLPAIEGTIDGVRWLGDVFATTGAWFSKWGAWLIPLGIIIGGLTIALNANAIATGIAMGVMGAYSLAVRGVVLITQGWAVAQGLLNSVMALNPFVLAAIAVIALGAALVVAYKKSEQFRAIVTAAWTAIAAGAMWLWNTVLSPTFSAISMGARILATALTVAVALPVIAAFKLLAAVGMWLWNAGLGPAFRGIGAAGIWLWQTALQPALHGIGAAALWLYAHAIRPLETGGEAALRLLGATGTWLWKNALSPAFRGIGAAALWLYEKGLKPPIDAGKRAARALGAAFTSAKDTIGKEFGKIGSLAKEPIAFVINTVYNRGIVGTWNKVAKAFGAPTLSEFHPKGFARGGVLSGQSSYRQGDDQLVPMRRGEGVAVSEAMRDPYERARLLAVNKAAMRGQSLRPFQGEGFAKGGIFGWVRNAASSAVDLAKTGVDWLKDGVRASAEAGLNRVVRPLLDRIAGSPSMYRDMISGIPRRMIKTILGFSGEADKKLQAAGIGGGGFKAGLRWARTQDGKRYQWGGNGNPSWDCSGFLSAIESVIRGQKPHRRWATGAFSGATAPPGWVLNRRSPYMIGITNAGVGHTAGTLNGVNVESRGGDGVVVGSRARSYKSSLFTHRYGYAGTYDQGGLLPPGLSAIYNGTSKPEAVLTGAQFNALAGSGDRIGAAVVAGMAQMGSAVEAAADRLGRSAAPAGVVPVTSSGGRAPAGAGPDGRPLYLLLEDGTAIRAYVSDRVDDALTDVRRAKRAGKK